MHSLNKKTYALIISLSALAGCVDAIGFLQLGGYFISFMSGNSTRLSVGLITGNRPAVALSSAIIVLFVIGTIFGVLIRHRAKSWPPAVVVLAFVTALLLTAAISNEAGWGVFAIAFLIFAMGAENAIFLRNGDVMLGLTYMTGTLVKVGHRMANAILGGPTFAWIPYLLLWCGLIAGGVIGTLLHHWFGLHSIWFAAGWAAILTLVTLKLKHRLSDIDH